MSPARRPDAAASPRPPDPAPTAASKPVARPIDSAQLFGGATEVHIHHHGLLYRLKQTSLGKLILTK